MCEALAGIRAAMGRCAAGFDAALVTATDAARVVNDAATIEKMAATIKALAAARVAETEVWRREGDRSPAHHLARTTGTTVGSAAEAINAARRLDQLPEAAAAARRGELSAGQVAAIADAATADPSAEAGLVDQARRSSLQELKEDCVRTRASAFADAEARRKRTHDRRCLRTYTDTEGVWHMVVLNNPELGAEIMAVIDPIRDRLFNEARVEGRREPTEAYAADALTTLVRNAGVATTGTGGSTATASAGAGHNGNTAGSDAGAVADASSDADVTPPEEAATSATPTTSGTAPTAETSAAAETASAARTASAAAVRHRATSNARAKIIVRVDLPALLRGHPVSGEVAEMVGYGPVAVSVIRDMIDSGDPFLTAVATRGVDVVGVAHLGRRPTVYQQTALEWLYPTCAVEGCPAVARLEMDHREDWATTHVTLFSLIDRLCPHHHRLKTRKNWGLAEGRGKRAFVPPTDGRHPQHASRRIRAPAAPGPPGAG